MDRIIQGRSATLTHVFYSDGIATDPAPDVTTVTVTGSDGTVLATGTATEAGIGVVTWTLTPEQTAILDTLTVTWTAKFGGQVQAFIDTVEIVGDVLFTIAEARQTTALADPVKYPTDRIVAMRTTVEDAIEEYTGALVPRFTVERFSGMYGVPLRLRHPFVRAVRSVAVDGTALTGDTLTSVTTDGSFLYGYRWPTGYSNIVVGYEHGRDRPPERIRRAALLLAKVWLVSGPVDDRTTSLTSPEGGTFSLATPGRGGSIFGVPECDAAVQAHSMVAIA